MSDLYSLYISRKCGAGLGRDRKIAFILPMLMILLITSVLVFALIFIDSVSGTIERMLEILGQGTIYVYAETLPDASLLPDGAEISPSRMLEGLVYSEDGESAAAIHAVGPDYFSGMRGRELGLIMDDKDVLNPSVVSSSFADKLGIKAGDRMTLLLYEEESGRTRPVLLTIAGIFPSVYPQLDSNLLYIPLETSGYDPDGYEVLLPPGSDTEVVERKLGASGCSFSSYMEMYSGIYTNAVSSLDALYAVFMAVALLAAYFASDAADVYVSRDRRDISTMMMLGASVGMMRGIYLRITMAGTAFAVIAGTMLGTAIGLVSPYIFRIIASYNPEILSYYVTSFTISFPWLRIALMLLLIVAIAAISVEISLRRTIKEKKV